MWAELLCVALGGGLGWGARTAADLRVSSAHAAGQAAAATANARAETAERQRDAALDALSTVAGLDDVDAVRAHARQAIEGGDYHGRLRATQDALQEAVAELADLSTVDEHAARALNIVRAEADTVTPQDALHLILARTASKDSSC